MANKPSKVRSESSGSKGVAVLILLTVFLCFFLVAGSFVRGMMATHREPVAPYVYEDNSGLDAYIAEYFVTKGAKEMIPIIGCESEFKHFSEDGEVLKNKQGSSAVGIAQIMASVHPDPSVIARYNKNNNTEFLVEDFDITTLQGNLAYAYVLYKVRGVKDWECAKKI